LRILVQYSRLSKGLSSLGKYIPGRVWHFIGRFGVYKINGLSAKGSTRALILENIWLLGSAVVTGAIGVFLTWFYLIARLLNIPYQQRLAILFTVIALILWLLILAVVHKILRRYTAEDLRNIFTVAGVGLLLWTFIGGGFFIMFDEMPLSAVPLFIGGYSVNWAVGYLVVFAPGGLGIREAVLALVFSNIAPVEMITIYGAMNRIIWVIAEVMFGLVGMLQKKFITPTGKNHPATSFEEKKSDIRKSEDFRLLTDQEIQPSDSAIINDSSQSQR